MTKNDNYDYTAAERQRLSRKRRAKAYMIIKVIAQRIGYMSSPNDYIGLDKFLSKFAISGNEIDWLEILDD